MKKFLLLVLPVIFLHALGLSQSPVTRLYDLRKYSYPIFLTVEADSVNSNTGIRDTFFYTGHGTCFFIRKSNRLFLVTAYHVFAFKPDIIPGRKIKPIIAGEVRVNIFPQYPDEMRLIIPIDRRILNADDINVMVNPDLFVYELPTKEYDSQDINSIEAFLSKDTNEVSAPLPMYSYGFPSIRPFSDIISFTNTDPDSASYVIPYAGKLRMDVSEINEKANVLLPHPANMHSRFNVDSLNYVANPKFAPGASGSPVFFSAYNNGQMSVWFAGIVSTISPIDDFTIIVKEEYLLKELDNLINSGKQYTIIPGVK